MSKDPAFLFYSKDYYEGTRMMLPEERACYVDLLVYQHQNGIIPFDTKRVLMYCNGVDKATLEATLKAKFEKTANGWENLRLKEEILSRVNYKSGQSDSGKLGQFWKKAKKLLQKSEYDNLKKKLIDKGFIIDFVQSNEVNINTLQGLLKGSLEGSLKHTAIANAIVNNNSNNNSKNNINKNRYCFVSIKNLNEYTSNFQGNKTYFLLAFRFWELWRKENPKHKHLEKADVFEWVDQVRLLIENDGNSIDRMIGILKYFDRCHKEDPRFDPFWFKNTSSLNGLRGRTKSEKVFKTDLIGKLVNDAGVNYQDFDQEVVKAIEKIKGHESTKTPNR